MRNAMTIPPIYRVPRRLDEIRDHLALRQLRTNHKFSQGVLIIQVLKGLVKGSGLDSKII